MNGTKRPTEAVDLFRQVVGERSVLGEVLAEAGMDEAEVRMSA